MQNDDKFNELQENFNLEKKDKLYSTAQGFAKNNENSSFYRDDGGKNYNQKTYKSTINFNTTMNLKNPKTQYVNTLSSNLASVRYLGISDFHSVNSLQNSSYVWSFGKSDRFVHKKPLIDSFYNVTGSFNNRSTTLGFGKKLQLKNLQGRNSPPPDTYTLNSQFENSKDSKKGKTIHEKFPLMVFNN
jgi:hypothetical protein